MEKHLKRAEKAVSSNGVNKLLLDEYRPKLVNNVLYPGKQLSADVRIERKNKKDDPNILRCFFPNSPNPYVTLFDERRLESLVMEEIRFPERVIETFFLGELCERYMRAVLYEEFSSIKRKNPSFDFTIMTGDQRAIKEVSDNYVLVCGRINNFFIYGVGDCKKGGKRVQYKNPVHRGHIGMRFEKEKCKDLLPNKSEIDALITISEGDEKAVIFCESKMDMLKNYDVSKTIETTLQPAEELFPDHPRYLLVMAREEDLITTQHCHRSRIRKWCNALEKAGVKGIFLSFKKPVKEFRDHASFVFRRFQEQLSAMTKNYQNVHGKYFIDDGVIVLSEPDGVHALTLKKKEDGSWHEDR